MTQRRTDRDVALVGGAPIDGLIRRVRRISELSQRDLAKRAGVSPSMVGAVESGAAVPSLATLQRLLFVADLRLVVVDANNRRVLPLEVWPEVADLAGRRFPPHYDTILDPVYGEWWADIYGLQSPPETFRRSRTWREWQREQSRWEVRVKLLRDVPPPRQPRSYPRPYDG